MGRRLILTIIIWLLFFTAGVCFMPDYGVNWDEPVHYMRGQVYMRFFLFGERDYSDLPKLRFHYPKAYFINYPKDIDYEDDSQFRRSVYQYDEYTLDYYLKTDSGHPPLNGELASLTNIIFYQTLGILGDIESYHLFTVFVSSLLVGFLFYSVASQYGIFAGVIAALSLVLYPLFFAESHVNVKDVVETAFFSITLLLFFKGITTGSWKTILVSSLFAGLALGTKFNILFAPLIVVPWLIFHYRTSIIKRTWPFSKAVTLTLIVYPLIPFAMLFLSWPYLWQNPLTNVLKIFDYYRKVGYETVYQPASYIIGGQINTYAMQWIFYTTPIVILVLSAFGLWYAVKTLKKNTFSLLLLLWFLTPILRVSLPNAGIYGGARQIMEYIPAMAILSGIGAYYIVSVLKKFKKTLLLQSIAICAFIPITLKTISIHPNESVYFNPLIGGLKGAAEKNIPDWGTTLGTDYLQGINWINAHAEPNANAGFIKATLDGIPRIKIRPDISFHKRYYSGPEKKGEYLLEHTDYRWENDIPQEQREYLETLVPVYEVQVDGVSILKAWKNDEAHSVK